MKVFFDDMSGENLFSMEVDSSETVLEVKQKIETCYDYSVSSQIIIFKGEVLIGTHDNRTLQQCEIVNNSRLQFYQLLHQQTEQSSVPFRGNFHAQDSSAMVGSSSKNQVLHQTEQSKVPSSSMKDVIIIDDSPEKNQDLTVTALRRNKEDHQVFHQTEQISSSSMKDVVIIHDSPEKITSDQDSTVMASSRNKEDHGTEQFTSNSLMGGIFGDDEDQPMSEEHFGNIQSFGHQNIRVMIPPYKPAGRATKPLAVDVGVNDNVPLAVNVGVNDNVEVLRIKIPGLYLPEGEYFFIHKGTPKPLDDHLSFRDQDVADGDTIETFPGAYK